MKAKLKIYEHTDTNEKWYLFTGCDYGCCSHDEIAVTKEPGKYPFVGTDNNKLKDTGEYTESVELDWSK